uniref:Elongation factor P n=2 Tax=Pseudo-nitzschia australis TaxID=44445 RepID=A0A7S4A9A7_9STRA
MARFSLFAVLALAMSAFANGFAPISSPSTALAGSRCSTQLAVAIDTSDIKNGMTIELDGEPWKVLSFSIMKQARGAAKTTIKFKNLMKGNTIENTYRSGEKFETALIEKDDHQYTYADGDIFFFMNSETFEEVPVSAKVVDDQKDWLEEGMQVALVFFKGNVIEVVVPTTGFYEIVETEPSLKGNTAQGYTKPAVLSCGATVTVPGYLESGEMIKVDTSKRTFLERANK